MKDKQTPRVLLVWDRMGDYHRVRVDALKNKIGAENVFAADLGAADSLYKWENTQDSNYVLLSDKPVQAADLTKRVRSFVSIIKKNKITVAGIAGYGRLEYLLFINACKMLGVKVVLFAESWYGSNPALNKAKGVFLNAACKGFLVSGERAKNHFTEKLGISPQKIRTGYSVVDNDHFYRNIDNDAQKMPDEVVRPILLCVARFSPEKNLPALVEAFAQSCLYQDWTLKLTGGGPEQQMLEELTGIHQNIVIEGWRSYNELPDLYAEAAAFVLPSTFEPWGLVVNEAAAAGLPLLISEACGCHPDLTAGEAAFIFDPESVESMTAALNQLGNLSATERINKGQAAQQNLSNYTARRWANSFIELAVSQ